MVFVSDHLPYHISLFWVYQAQGRFDVFNLQNCKLNCIGIVLT